MSSRWFFVATSVAAIACSVAEAAPEQVETLATSTRLDDPRVRSLLDRLPLAYEVNRGQAPEDYDFLVRCRGYHAFVASHEVVFSFDGVRLTMSLDGAAHVEPETRGLELPGKLNYFLGNDASKWLSNIPITRGAAYPDVATGTTWEFGGEGRALEFVLDLAPGVAGPSMRLEGALGAVVATDGTLRIAMPHGVATFSAPVAWQDVPGPRTPVTARWVSSEDGTFRIDVAAHDASRRVHVDPTVTYESYLGTSVDDYAYGCAIDAAGAPYFVTKTNSGTFPTTNGSYDSTLSGTYDLVVTKVSASGSALVYSTYVGGTGEEYAGGIEVDASGNAYVAGLTSSSTYPTTSGVYRTSGSGNLGFITEFNASGTGLVFSTFTQSAVALGPALTASGSVYVIEGNGVSSYSSGGVTQTFHRQIMPTSYSGQQVSMNALAADSAGDVYVVGGHGTPTFSATNGAYQTSLSGNSDAFLTKIASSGNLVYTTFLGGTTNESATGVGVNWQGEAYVVGNTSSSNFPQTSDALSVGGSAFATRFNATGSAVRFSTLIGQMTAYAVRVHPSGAFVVVGDTQSSQVPISNAFQSSSGGGNDCVVMKFNPERTLAWCSWWGGSGYDAANYLGLGMAPNGSVAVQAGSLSDDLPTVSPYQSQRVGTNESIQLVIPDTLPTTLTNPTVGATTLPEWTVNRLYSQTIVPLGGLAPYTFTVSSGALPPGTALSAAGTLSGTPTQSGTSTFSVSVLDVCEKTGSGSVTVKVNPAPAVSTGVMQGWTIGVPCDQALAVTGGTPPFAFELTGGAAPEGTTFSAAGHVVGTPTALGVATMDVRVQDAAGAVALRQVTFRVNAAPSIDAATLPECTEARPYSFTFSTTAGTAPFTWFLLAGPGPADLDAVAGKLAGSSRAAGTYVFTVRATDSAGVVAQRSFSATINPTPQVPVTELPAAAVGRPYTAHLPVTGGTPPFNWTTQSGSLPAGVALDAATGTLGGDVTAAASGVVVFRATDACGAVASRAIVVDAAEPVNLTSGRAGAKVVFTAGGATHTTRFLELTAGAALGIIAKGGAKDAVLPQLVLTGPDGQPLDLGQWTTATTKAIAVKGFPVPATGRYFITFTPAPGFEGKTKLTVTLTPRGVWTSGATLAPDAPTEFAFTAPPGAKVLITAKASTGSTALPAISSLLDPDGIDLLPSGTGTAEGGSAKFVSKVPLAGGDYRVAFATRDASAGDVTWTVKLKLPKKYAFALPDVPAGD